MKPKPLQPLELMGSALICTAAIALTAVLPGQLRFVASAAVWILGTVLVSAGGITLTRHASRAMWMTGPLVAVAFTSGTAFFLSSTLRVPAIILTGFHAAYMSFTLLHAFQRRQTAAAPVQAAIRVRTQVPRPPQCPLEQRSQPETEENGTQHEIDAGLEQALLSRLSVDAEDETDLEREEEHPPEAVQFRKAETQVFQRLERGQVPEGGEWLEGTIRVDFLRNQKTSIVHIPFWPAFSVRPDVSSELLEGPQLTIEAKAVERWGIRLELTRRAAGLDPDFAELAFFVSTQTAARKAA